MARSKAPLFPELPFHQSIWAKALSHPARILILTHLHESGLTPYRTLCKRIPLARTTVSQHLQILRDAGFIILKEEFPHSYYELNPKVCKALSLKIMDINSRLASDPVSTDFKYGHKTSMAKVKNG
jgi:DNA-binding transcriptional ArsR family regulator